MSTILSTSLLILGSQESIHLCGPNNNNNNNFLRPLKFSLPVSTSFHSIHLHSQPLFSLHLLPQSLSSPNLLSQSLSSPHLLSQPLPTIYLLSQALLHPPSSLFRLSLFSLPILSLNLSSISLHCPSQPSTHPPEDAMNISPDLVRA
ncbi:hypothetical protein E2C01_030521 [Portunus trituberculatus]|uniref:Uncharacterized protein n=1 Tax=Portunus trituberculatus TaxID=210409 RepID=A0A5B7EVJ2_PORTR|nr:hypothetical protein [Portunus trituberculatus]